MSQSTKNSQEIKKSSKIPLPKNTKIKNSSRFSEIKINKDNKVTSKQQQEGELEYNVKNINKFPPKITNNFLRANSAGLRKYERILNQVEIKRKKNRIEYPKLNLKDDLNQEKKRVKTERVDTVKTEIVNAVKTELGTVKTEIIGAVKKEVGGVKKEIVGVKKEIVGVKKEIVGVKKEIGEVKTEVTKINKNLNDLKNILIDSFHSLFALLKKDNTKFEKSVKFLIQNDEQFKIEENTLKADKKIEESSNKKSNNTTSNDASWKNSNSSNGNNHGSIKGSFEINKKKSKTNNKKQKYSSSSSNSNNNEKAIVYGNNQMITSNNVYSPNDTIQIKKYEKGGNKK